MDVFHVFLGRPWHFDKKVIYDGSENTFTFEKDGKRHTLLPLKDEKPREQVIQKVLFVGGKECLHQLKSTKVNFVMVDKPRIVLTSTICSQNVLPRCTIIEYLIVLNNEMDSYVKDAIEYSICESFYTLYLDLFANLGLHKVTQDCF